MGIARVNAKEAAKGVKASKTVKASSIKRSDASKEKLVHAMKVRANVQGRAQNTRIG